MDREAFVEELREVISGYLSSRQVDLVELTYRFEGGRAILRILADKPSGGITLEECAILNQEISAILDEKNLIQESYVLEVSSPGLDRPLKTKKDFLRCLNKRVRLFLYQPLNGRFELEGELQRVDDEGLYIVLEHKEEIRIDLKNIRKGKQCINTN
ncbi:MAG: ribosome maturation factor RimP [Candidatus Omnitrophica bacterium]|nr:ribosome maturation factor RimP [Candidatus Omnitrophota bacterium]